MNDEVTGNEYDEDESEVAPEETPRTSTSDWTSKTSEKSRDSRDTLRRRALNETLITREHLKRVEEELCLVRLCWPDVDLNDDDYAKALPEAYRTVSDKERLLAWYAENFRRQFREKFPERKPLLLICENECGVQKFVSTTIRRSTLPYPELYTWQGCGKFVSDYIEYEPLDKALSMPRQLRSPTWLLNFQRGNCFEMATFLASLLLGQGYNAFVVSGYASREQTLCDMTRLTCPYLPQSEKPPPPAETIDTSKYELKPPTDFRSQFLLELEAEEETKIQEESKREEKERLKKIDELERPPFDEYWGRRIHAWVVILPEHKGPRDHETIEPIFIEPSSGLSYKPSNPRTNRLYMGIESIWNDQNYWVNMQETAGGCAELNWDLSKVEFWEHLLPGEPWTMRGMVDEIDEDISILQEKHLDMPASYVNRIFVPELEFELRYPDGKKVIYYKKSKVEFFAPYVQPNGIVQRVTTYLDYKYTVPVEVFEEYSNRSDNLRETRKYLKEDSIVDYYKRGRIDQCKEHRYFESGRNTIDSERILDFYHYARIDGLSRIETHPAYLTEHFENRDDLLFYRHVEFPSDENEGIEHDIHCRHIRKIIEKYRRDEKVKASKNVAIREFAIDENEIRLLFHYEEGRYSRATRTYVKPPLADRGNRLVFNPSLTHGYNPNPLAEPDKTLDLFYELDKQLKEEDRSISQARAAELEVFTFLKARICEYFAPELLVSPFDTHRDIESQLELSAKDEKARAQTKRQTIDDIDHLQPYLARIGNPSKINATQAYLLQEECLTDYKQLLVRRANDILRKFDECTQELDRMQSALTQNEDLTRDEEEEILTQTDDINFKLHTLEVRLNRHKDLVPKRYAVLTDRLKHHPQLSAFYKESTK